MNIAVLDAGTLGADLSLDTLKEFGTLNVYQSTASTELLDRLKDAEVVVVNKVHIGADALATAPKLKLICVAATGYDNIDLDACRKKGVGVCNVAGYSTDSVAPAALSTGMVTENTSVKTTDVPIVRDEVNV